MDPGSASSIGKLAALVGKPLYVLARHQFDRRGAKTIAAADPVTIEKEIAEAIAVLRRGGESLSGSAWNYIKSVLSDRPAIFDTQEAQDWLALDDVQSLLRRATEALIAGRDLAEFESEGRRLYSISAEEADWWGGLLFDYAVSFIALTLRTRASFDARLQMVAANERDAVILEDLRELKAASLSQTEILENLATNGRGAPVDIIDRYLADEIARRDSLRAIVAVNSISDVDTLGERVRSGDLAGASSAARINTYRFVAAMHARDGTPNAAEAWLNAAFAEGTNDLAPDYARIALSKREFGQAISYLNGRTDALSNSLRLDIIQQRDGAAAAIEYFETYSAPGQVTGFLLASLANWLADERGVAAGEALLAASTEEQLLENRTLRFHRLRFRLALCVPLGEQARVIAEYGMLPPPGSLRDDAEGQRLKALALEDARQLLADIERDAPEGFVELVQLTTNYLALISPDQAVREAALESVKQLLAVPETRVVFAPLSMIFDIDFDRQALAAQLDQTARLTGWNDAELRAAFDLAVDSKDAQRISTFVNQHRDRVIAIAGPRYAIGIQVEALAKAGRISDARGKLNEATELSDPDVRFLEDLIKDATGDASPDLHLNRFEQTDLEQDLYLFVEALRQANDPRLPDFAYQLWQRRRRVSDAVVAASAFATSNRNTELRDFLAELGDTISMEPALQSHLAWIRYREGRLDEADALLTPLRGRQPDNESLRQLKINVAIEAGEWHGLDELFREDVERAEHRSAQQLLQSATLASAVGNPEGKSLLRAGAAKAGEDPHIYANAFLLALRRGEDLEDEPIDWLNRAIALSDHEGPLRSFEIREVIAARDQEAERAATINRLVLSGQVPLTLATKAQGTSLAALILLFSALNESEPDARRRFYLPAYAGNRLQPSLAGAKRIAIEPTALFVLHRLGLLEETFDAFETIILPAGTLPSLLNAAIGGNRGQPSRSRRAEEILRLVRNQRLHLLDAPADGVDTIDHLFGAAQDHNGRLVHIPPLHVAGSFGQEIRDPTPFLSRLASVSGIVDALQTRGEVNETEVQRAKRFPSVRLAWDDETSIDLNQPLILDAVSLHYLIDADLIAPLIRIDTPLLVPSVTIQQAEAELAEQEQVASLLTEIENLRSVLNASLRSGRVVVGPALGNTGFNGADDDDAEESMDPLVSILQDSAGADRLVADDRMVNQHGQFEDGVGSSNGTATSLDVLRHLLAEGRIDAARYATSLHRLRMSGFGLIPVQTEEIMAAATKGDWSQGPSRSLRVIRDSLVLPVLRQSIMLPLERHWVEQTLLAVARAIKQCFWTMPEKSAESAAQFLFALLLDVRAIASQDNSPEVRLWAESITVAHLVILATPLGADPGELDAYHRWFDGEAVERLQGRDADLQNDVIARLKDVILTYRDRLILPKGTQPPPRAAVARWIFLQIPKILREQLETDDDIRTALELPRLVSLDDFVVSVEGLNAFLTEALQGVDTALFDVNGEQVSESITVNEDSSVSITKSQRRIRFEHAALFSPDLSTRLAALQDFLSEHTLSPSGESFWRGRVSEGPLDSAAMQGLSQDAQYTVEVFVQSMIEAMSKDDFDINDLVDVPDRHFLSFAEDLQQEGAFDILLDQLAARRRDGCNPVAAAIASAPMALAPSFSIEAFTGSLSDEAAVRVATQLIEHGDPFSLLAAFELVAARVSVPACRALGDRLMEDLWGPKGSASDLAEDFCTAAIVTATICRWNGHMRSWPLAGRRIALLGHAGLICRVFRHYQIERPGLLEQVNLWFGQQFRICALIESADAPSWSLNSLLPASVEAYLLRRFDSLLDKVAENARPQAWLDTIKARVERFEGPLAGFFLMTGPLDEFSERGDLRPVMSTEDFDRLVDQVDVEPSLGVADLLLRVAMIFQPPTGIDPTRLIDVIISRANTAEGELRFQYQQVAFQLAIAWTLSDLAERAAALLPQENQNASSILEQALTVAAAQSAQSEQTNALKRYLLASAVSRPLGESAQALDRALAVLVNGEPRLAVALHDAKLATALAL